MDRSEAADYFAALICGLLLLIVVATIWLVPHDQGYLLATFTPEHVAMFDMFDSRGQQAAHRVLVVLIGILALGLWALRPAFPGRSLPVLAIRSVQLLLQRGGFLIAALVIAILVFRFGFGILPFENYYDFQGRYVLGVLPSALTQVMLVGLASVAVYLASIYRPQGRVADTASILFLLIVGLYAMTLISLGILHRPDFSGFSQEHLAGIEWHYSGSVGSADRLALGERLGDVPIHSGALPSVLLGLWQKTFGTMNFGRHIRTITALQALLLLVTIAAYGIWYSKRAAPWILSTLLVLPWIQPLHAAVLYPNQSAWRFFGLGLGALALVLVYAREIRSVAVVLGLVGGFACLWNVETGICLSVAYLAFLTLRTLPRTSPIAPLILRFAFGFGACAIVFIFAVRFGFGYWLDLAAMRNSFPLISDFSKGYGGLRFKDIDPLALLIFLHALYTVIRGLLSWCADEAHTPRDACQIAFAVLIVLWAGYYFKGPDPWNLWSFLLLYGFLLGNLLTPFQRRRGALGISDFLASTKTVSLAMIVLPALALANAGAVKAADVVLRQTRCAHANILSGTCLPREIAHALREKAALLSQRSESGLMLYFTSNSYSLPLLSGVSQPLRQRDPFFDSILKSDFDRLVQDILALQPNCLLFDDPSSFLNGYDYQRRFYRRLQVAVADLYQRQPREKGWEISCLKR